METKSVPVFQPHKTNSFVPVPDSLLFHTIFIAWEKGQNEKKQYRYLNSKELSKRGGGRLEGPIDRNTPSPR